MVRVSTGNKDNIHPLEKAGNHESNRNNPLLEASKLIRRERSLQERMNSATSGTLHPRDEDSLKF